MIVKKSKLLLRLAFLQFSLLQQQQKFNERQILFCDFCNCKDKESLSDYFLSLKKSDNYSERKI